MQNPYPTAFTAGTVKPKPKGVGSRKNSKTLSSPLFEELKEQFPDLPHRDIVNCIEKCAFDKDQCVQYLTDIHQLMQTVNNEMNENSEQEPSYIFISPLTIDTSGDAGHATIHRPNALIPANQMNHQQTQLLTTGAAAMNDPCYSPAGGHLHISEIRQRIQTTRIAYNPFQHEPGTVRQQCEQMEKLLKELENECIRLNTLRQDLEILDGKFKTKSAATCGLSVPLPEEIQRISRENTKLHSEIANMQQEIDSCQTAPNPVPVPVPYPVGFAPYGYPPLEERQQSPLSQPILQQPVPSQQPSWRMAPTRPPPPIPDQRPLSTWTCQWCTLHNPPDTYLCKACERPRPDMSPSVRNIPGPPGPIEQWDVNPAYTGRRT